MHAIVDTRAPLPTLVIYHNSDWSGDALLIVGVGQDAHRYVVDGFTLLHGVTDGSVAANHLIAQVPPEVLLRAVAVAARSHALQQARAALDDLA